MWETNWIKITMFRLIQIKSVSPGKMEWMWVSGVGLGQFSKIPGSFHGQHSGFLRKSRI